jgi:hypothetical protein
MKDSVGWESTEVQEKRKRPSGKARFIVPAVIIILLAPLFLMAELRSCEGARRAKCLSNLKQIGLGIKQYALDNNEILPFVYDDMEPYQALGKLHPAYTSELMVFHCPGSGDEEWNLEKHHPINKEPFSKESCKRSLSYAYGHNKGKPWTEAANGSTRIAADKYAAEDYSTASYNKNKPLNHPKSCIGSKPAGRNIVRLDGSAQWDFALKPLEADPDCDYEKNGHSESDQTGADWWSDPPGK